MFWAIAEKVRDGCSVIKSVVTASNDDMGLFNATAKVDHYHSIFICLFVEVHVIFVDVIQFLLQKKIKK